MSDEDAGGFKSDDEHADDPSVDHAHDGYSPSPNDTVGTAPGGSGFSFNLGEALARLTGDGDPRADVTRRPTAADGVPSIHEATGPGGLEDLVGDNPSGPLAATGPSWSSFASGPTPDDAAGVFDAPSAGGPSVFPSPIGFESSPSLPAAASLTTSSTARSIPETQGAAESLAGPSNVAVMELPILPSAPAAAAPPMAAPLAAMPTTPIPMRAPTAAMRKAQRKGRVLPKLLLVLVVFAGLVAGAYFFGRGYLFPNEWEKDLVPVVDELQATTRLEFDDPVVLRALPATEYGTLVVGSTFGDDWAADAPRWRALGLAVGEPVPDDVATAVGGWWPSSYDVISGDALRVDTLRGDALTAAQSEALALALFDQKFGSRAETTEVSAAPGADAAAAPDATTDVAEESVALERARRAIVDHQAELTAGTSGTTPSRARLASLPAPMAYELLAIEELGAPLLRALGVTPAPGAPGRTFESLDQLPVVVGPAPRAAGAPEIVAGDVVDGESAAIGADDWYLVFGAYLPADAAGAAADAIAADLWTPAVRGGRACVYGTFTAPTPEAGQILQFALASWVAGAPPEATAAAVVLPDGTQQLSTCDPGVTTTVVPRTGVANELVARQIARLGG
jgi:hypothetical protein